MEEKLGRGKRVMIISPNKQNYKSSDDTAILKLKKKNMTKCIGNCSITDCLSCDSCFFELVYKNGMYIRDEEFLSCESESVEYLIEFFGNENIFDLFMNRQIISYLQNEDNDYRITSKDGTILKLSHADWGYHEKMNINADFSDYFTLSDSLNVTEKTVSSKNKGLKKIFMKVWKENV